MMKQHTSLLLIFVGGILVPSLSAVQKKATKAPSSLSASKILGALGLAGVAAAGAYYANDKDDATKKFEGAKCYLGGVSNSVISYVKNTDKRAIALGVLGTAVTSYLAYKFFIKEKDQDEEVDCLTIATPDSDAFLNDVTCSSRTSLSKKSIKGSSEFYGNWPHETLNLFSEVCSSIKDDDKSDALMKVYLESARQDPHQLIRDKKLIERMSPDQKLKLLDIMVNYTMDRIIKSGQALNGSLKEGQEGIEFMLNESLESALGEHKVFALRDLLSTLVTEEYISGAQANFIKGELAIIKKCVEIQARFSKAHDLDALLAKRLPSESQATTKMHKASPARR
jgi:hypothetical protein